ncbi:histidinol-phosphatase [compost metagenome]
MLEEAFTLGIPLTIGSDAHDPAKLAEHLEKARALLYEVGYRELAVFQHRERSRVPLAL